MPDETQESFGRRAEDDENYYRWWNRALRFWEQYGRDVWLMITTIIALVGVALALGAASKAQNLAESNCERGKLVAPLIVQVIGQMKITDPVRVEQYKRAVPTKC